MSKLEKPRVLLVDDNDGTCTLVTAILQRDFFVEVAGDGLDAVEKLKTNQYAAILLDLRMPQLDGFGVLEFLQQNAPDVLARVIVLTAALTASEIARVKQHRICAIVAKPFEVESLLDAVRQCVEGGTASLGNVIYSGTGVILLLADLLRQRWML